MIAISNNNISGVKLGNSDVELYLGSIKVYGLDPFNGYEYVDLGLPSGTLWAKCNVGADNETDYGSYYMYGKGTSSYVNLQSTYDGNEDPLSVLADTAAQVMGGQWHMPTQIQLEELIANTTFTWETNFNDSGINGGKFTATNGNYIFLPAYGYKYNGVQNNVSSGGNYWSSTPGSNGRAYNLDFYDGGNTVNYYFREYGCTVRGVVG